MQNNVLLTELCMPKEGNCTRKGVLSELMCLANCVGSLFAGWMDGWKQGWMVGRVLCPEAVSNVSVYFMATIIIYIVSVAAVQTSRSHWWMWLWVAQHTPRILIRLWLGSTWTIPSWIPGMLIMPRQGQKM